MDSERVKGRYDKLGILASAICVIHCTLIPVTFTILSIIDDPLNEFSFVLDFLFVILAITAVYFSSKNSFSKNIKTLLWFFVTLFALGVVLEHDFTFGKVIALTGSFGLIFTHLFNLKSCRKCEVISA